MNFKKLKDLKCKACSDKTPKLSLAQINKYLDQLLDWTLNEESNMIYKKYIFKNFKSSLKFTNLVGLIAEKELHHPDISIGYSYCLIMLHTHSIKSLSINDFILASKIDLINFNL